MTSVEVSLISLCTALVLLTGTVIKMWAKDIKIQRATERDRSERVERIIKGNTEVMTELKGMVKNVLHRMNGG